MRTLSVRAPQSISLQRGDDVLARARLVVRRDRILEIEKHHVGGDCGSPFRSFSGSTPGTASSERCRRGVAGS